MHSLSGFAWRGVVLRCMVLALGFINILGGGVPAAFVVWAFISPCGALPGRLHTVLAVSGSFAYEACACACPRGFCLAQRSVCWCSCAF